MTKNQKKILPLFDPIRTYKIEEAIELIKQVNFVKFVATFELAICLNLDVRKTENQIRGSLILPAGTGKIKKILAITKSQQTEAKNAGADIVGDQELINKIKTQKWFDFDVIVATPDLMVELSKIGNILGPKGLMPNLKTKTVTNNIAETIAQIRKGLVEYRVDKTGNIHVPIGKLNFDNNAVKSNFQAIMDVIIKSKPSTNKGVWIKNITLSSTMGPGLKISL